MKKILLNKQIYDVIDSNEYFRRKELNPDDSNNLMNETAIEKDGYVYPIIAPSNNNEIEKTIGVRDYGPAMQFIKPQTVEQMNDYSANRVLDFERSENLRETIQKRAQLESMERSILIDKDNIYNISINENDTPEFALLKEAINKKQIDINSYKSRFDDSFSNNMRLLSTSNSITFGKLKAFANVFDLDIEVTIKDKPGCVNPIGEELKTDIT